MDDVQRPRPVSLTLPVGNDPVSVRQRIEALEFLLERMKKTDSNQEFLDQMNQ